jgi:plasmid stabilization system protein ParE
MVKLKFTLQTQSDLRNIYQYIALDSPINARCFIKDLKTRSQILKKYPDIGHLVLPEKFKNLW